MRKPLLRLLQAVVIGGKNYSELPESVYRLTIPYGFILEDKLVRSYATEDLSAIIDDIVEVLGLSIKQMNSSFHKSWYKVQNTELKELVLEQAIHYFSTYGAELLGLYDESHVYIPDEVLEIPELPKNLGKLSLRVIKGYTKDEIWSILLGLLHSGIALKEDTVKDVVDVVQWLGVASEDFSQLKNKEVAMLLYKGIGDVPEKPQEFLRYVCYLVTGSTLLIKDRGTVRKIQDSPCADGVEEAFLKYSKHHGISKLAEVFYRFKPLFLAFRNNPSLRRVVNKIRRLARVHHKPMKQDYLNNVTTMFKKDGFDRLDFELNLQSASVFRKIRILYALKYRMCYSAESIMYRIRNGKAYATAWSTKQSNAVVEAYNMVKNSIVLDLYPKLNGKRVYVPQYIKYALPATEKQFTGMLPSGTCVMIPSEEDGLLDSQSGALVGIHWKNVSGKRIDLDLSLMQIGGKKIGWDGYLRHNDVLFSGDMTDASGVGASELFHISCDNPSMYMMYVNYFNYSKDVDVPFSIIVGRGQSVYICRNYTVSPEDIVCRQESVLNNKQKLLCLISTGSEGVCVYFCAAYLGNSITAGNRKFMDSAIKYLRDFYSNGVYLRDILRDVGCRFVDNPECSDIDLSYEKLGKDTIINLLK